jgi:tetratricopeptide (TPR) repeat protein
LATSPGTWYQRPVDVASGYVVTAAARLCGMSVSRVRAMIAAGVVQPERDDHGHARLSFEEIRRLRQLGELAAEISAPRLRRVLDRLGGPQQTTPPRLHAAGRRLWAAAQGKAWEPESGQMLLPLSVAAGPPAAVSRLPTATADAHYQRGRALEVEDPAAACESYRHALAIDPAHADANINLGRLVHESGQADAAVQLYRAALSTRPDDAVAWFNLGVALGDMSDLAGALAAYRRVLEIDPACADAHHNAARLCERRGDRLGTVRHLRAYRALCD